MTQIDQPESLSMAPPGAVTARRRGAVARLIGFSLLVTCHVSADVTSGTWLEVEREGDTSDCPSGEELEAVTEELLGPTAPPSRAPIRVSFRVENGLYRARFHPRGSLLEARELADRTTNCEALEQALGTALALWIDSDWARERTTERPPPEPKRVEPVKLVAEKSREKQPDEGAVVLDEVGPVSSATRAFGEVALRGGASLALTTPLAPLVAAEVAVGTGRWRFGVGGTWILPSEVERGVGSASSELAYGTLRLCWEMIRLGSVDFTSCTGFSAGAMRATARGYSTNDSRLLPWFGVPLELSVGQEWARRLDGSARGATSHSDVVFLQVRLGVSLVVPTTKQTFSVDGVGTVIDPAPAAGLFWLEWRGGLSL